MNWINNFNLFLFDLDGLLVNTEELHFEAYQLLCRRYGLELSWTFQQYAEIAQISSEYLRDQIFTALPLLKKIQGDWKVLYEVKKKIYLKIIESEKLMLMPGVKALLTKLADKGLKHAVVTHSSKEQTNLIQSRLPELQSIPTWITREDYTEAKPSPDSYFRAIELLADRDDQIIGFEDSFRGIRSLQQTPALPILINSQMHPQLQEEVENQTLLYFSSFEKSAESFLPQ